MEQIQLLINQYLVYIVLGLAGAFFLLFILLIMNYSKMKKIQAKYEKFMSRDNIDLEELLTQYTKKLNKLLENDQKAEKTIANMQEQLKFCVQKVGVIRYNALANTGADLSFAIALLDEKDNGVVFNGIYSRDGSYTYAKPILDGKSTYTLSEEEIQAIDKAKKQEDK